MGNTFCAQLLEAGADFEAQTSTGERALHMAIMRMDIRILASLLDVGADSKAPSLQMWQGPVLRTPLEMCQALPPPYNQQILGVLEMTVKQRENIVDQMESNANFGDVRREAASFKIHVLKGVKVTDGGKKEDEPY